MLMPPSMLVLMAMLIVMLMLSAMLMLAAMLTSMLMLTSILMLTVLAALLNPIVPIYDDFLFIRPAVMTARSTGNRLEYAQRGLQDAIKRLR